MKWPWKKIGEGIEKGLTLATVVTDDARIEAARAMIHAVEAAVQKSGPEKKDKVSAGFHALIRDEFLALSPMQQAAINQTFGDWNDVYVALQNLTAREEAAYASLKTALAAIKH